MPHLRWVGGASANTMHLTLTPGGVLGANDHFDTTLYGEDNTSVTIRATSTATTVAAACDAIYALLSVSTNELFTAITWSDETTHIKALAKVGGKPFKCQTSASATATTIPTYVTATTTANSGPFDFGTLANFINSGGNTATLALASGDTLRINQGTYSILYGLRASGINLENLNIGEQFTGSVGQYENNYPLAIHVANSADSYVAVNGRGATVQLTGSQPHVLIQGTGGGSKACRIGGSGGVVDDLQILGGEVKGTVTVVTGCNLDNVYVQGSPQALVEIETGVTSLDIIEGDSGFIRTKSACVTVNVNGTAQFESDVTAANPITTFNNRGGNAALNCNGTITNANHYSGITDMRRSKAASLTFTNTIVRSGLWVDTGSLANITYTSAIKNYGGVVNTETGTVDRFAEI